MIEYQSPLLINNFTHIKNKEEQGKIYNCRWKEIQRLKMIKIYLKISVIKIILNGQLQNQKVGKVFNIDEERYLVTTSEILP